jgi:hypothetical protein
MAHRPQGITLRPRGAGASTHDLGPVGKALASVTAEAIARRQGIRFDAQEAFAYSPTSLVPTLDLQKSPPTPNPLLHFGPSYAWLKLVPPDATNNTPLNDGPASTPMTPTECFARDAAQSLQLRRP